MNPSQRIETMHRRNFIKTAAGAACFSALGSTALWAGEKAGDKPASDTNDRNAAPHTAGWEAFRMNMGFTRLTTEHASSRCCLVLWHRRSPRISVRPN